MIRVQNNIFEVLRESENLVSLVSNTLQKYLLRAKIFLELQKMKEFTTSGLSL